MGEFLFRNWPFFLLIGTFVVFSVHFARTLGKGNSGTNYISLMEQQVAAMHAQIAQQGEVIDLLRRQTEALERIADRRPDE